MRLLCESIDESACPVQRLIEIVDAEEQDETVARGRFSRAHQGGMFVRAPFVKTEQHGSIRIQDLTKVVMGWRRLGLAEERLIPFQTATYVSYADNGPNAFHSISAAGLIIRVAGKINFGWFVILIRDKVEPGMATHRKLLNE